MKKILIGTLLLCILHSILLVDQSWGVNVIIFMLPLLGFIVYVLKENKCILDKKGLLFMIPIIILSISMMIYDSSTKLLNVLAIPTLYFLMYMFTMKKAETIMDMVIEILNLTVKPLDSIGKFVKDGCSIIFKDKKLSPNTKKTIKSILIILPIVLFVLLLLSSADMIFGSIFENLFKVFKHAAPETIIFRSFIFVLLFFYLGSSLYFLTKEYPNEKRATNPCKKKDPYTIKLLLTILNIIYILFDVIQIHSLLLHRVSSSFNYAEYARSGFFQLMLISVINLAIILISKRFEETKYNKIMSVGMILLTMIIIVSSFYRMYLYEQAYGYTVLRLGVYTILVTEAILLLPTIAYIINSKVNILKFYVAITISVYTLVNCVSVDNIITSNNIARYKKIGQIDIEYLLNGSYDNLNQLRELEKLVEDDEKIRMEEKAELKTYIGYKNKENKMTIWEWNLARVNAKK